MGPIRFSHSSKLWGSATHTAAGVRHLFFYPSAPGSYEYLLSESFAQEYAETSKLGVTHLYVTNRVPTLSSPRWEPLQAVTQGKDVRKAAADGGSSVVGRVLSLCWV